VIQCKGCGENIPAPVETVPAQAIAAKCPLRGEHRRYLPSELFQGRLSYKLLRKPVRTADGRVTQVPVRILVNYMHRDGWSVHTLAKDARTPIGPWIDVAGESTLLRLLRACGATDEGMEQVKADIRQWGRGSVWIDVSEIGMKLLRIRA
jgi:hypothetical protein